MVAAASSLRLPVLRAPGAAEDFAGRESRHCGEDRTGPRHRHLWLLDMSGGAQQMTDGPMHEGSPIWSPDGSRIAHFGKQGDAYDIFVRPAQVGSKAELLLKTADRKFPSDWSHDGKYIVYSVEGAGTRLDLWGLSVGDRRAAPILDTVFAEAFATISPDGKWMAYQSDQSGRNEVYVQSFDGLNNGTSGAGWCPRAADCHAGAPTAANCST